MISYEYPKRFINAYIPINHCNLRCPYCYIGHTVGYNNTWYAEDFKCSFEHMRKCLSVDRLDGVCIFNLCADGETLLFKRLPEFVRMCLELGHYVSIVTNATLEKPLRKLLELPAELTERMFIKCSFHYTELKRLDLLDTFFGNIDLIKRSRISFSVELTANDESVPLIPEIKAVCMERLGALCHVIESRYQADEKDPRLTKLPLEEHQAAWGSFHSPLFDYQQKNWGRKIDDFCYAGEYRISMNVCNGDVYQCDRMAQMENMYASGGTASPPLGTISSPHIAMRRTTNPSSVIALRKDKFNWCALGKNCSASHCWITYVHSVHCNCWGENMMKAPTYAEERDRVCADGSHWLTERFQDVFGHRMSEFHEPYSEDKKFYIDLLMRKVYRGHDPLDWERKRLGEILHARFKTAALCGDGAYSAWLWSILVEAGIQVKYTIDTSVLTNPNSPSIIDRVKRRYKYFIKRKTQQGCVSLYVFDHRPKVDIIIVTDWQRFGQYEKMIHESCCSITELVK